MVRRSSLHRISHRECGPPWSWTLNSAPGSHRERWSLASSGASFLAGGNDVICPSSASAAAADRGINCWADHCYRIHLVGGGARRPHSAWAAGEQVHVVGIGSDFMRPDSAPTLIEIKPRSQKVSAQDLTFLPRRRMGLGKRKGLLRFTQIGTIEFRTFMRGVCSCY